MTFGFCSVVLSGGAGALRSVADVSGGRWWWLAGVLVVGLLDSAAPRTRRRECFGLLLVLWLRVVRCGLGSGRVRCRLVALEQLVTGDAALAVDEEVARGALWSC